MLEELRAAEAGQTIYDKGEKTSVTGLHLRVGANGAKAFFLYYRTRAGQQRRPKIGVFGEITLSQARERARKLLDRVAVGEDPKAGWDEKKGEATVQELFELVWKDYWSQDRYQVSGHAKQVKWCFDRHIKPAFGSAKLSEVTPMRVRQWHGGFESTYNANHALRVLGRMFRFAEEQEIRRQHTNPCALVKQHPERERKRFASVEEIQKIVGLLEQKVQKNPAGVAFLYLLMFTGSRPRAIERATWDQLKEFEMDGKKYGFLTFHGKSSGKTGQEERVVIPPQAMKALSRLPRVEGWTITGIKMPRTLWREIKKEAGCPDLWARDWRRTFATIGMSNGVDIGTIGELLNHRTTETTKIYAKVMDDSKLKAATAIATRIESIAQAGTASADKISETRN